MGARKTAKKTAKKKFKKPARTGTSEKPNKFDKIEEHLNMGNNYQARQLLLELSKRVDNADDEDDDDYSRLKELKYRTTLDTQVASIAAFVVLLTIVCLMASYI